MQRGACALVPALHARRPLRRRPRPRRRRRHDDDHRGDADAAGRRAEADGLDAGLGQHRAVRRREGHHADVLGRRHRRPQPAVAPHPRQRGRRASPAWSNRRRPAVEADEPPRPLARRDDVRRHDAVRDGGARSSSKPPATTCWSSTPPAPAAGRWRRSIDDGYFARRPRRHHDRVVRRSGRRRADGRARSLTARRPARHPAGRVGRRPRHGQLRRRSTPCRQQFAGRTFYRHNADGHADAHHAGRVRARSARRIAAQLNRATGPVALVLPLGGVSAIDAPGQPFHDPEADAALFEACAPASRPRPVVESKRTSTTPRSRTRWSRRCSTVLTGPAVGAPVDLRHRCRSSRKTALGRLACDGYGAAADRRRRRRHGHLGEVRRARRRRPDHHLQLGPLPHGRPRQPGRPDALRRRQRHRHRHGARGAAGRAATRRCWPACAAPTRSASCRCSCAS